MVLFKTVTAQVNLALLTACEWFPSNSSFSRLFASSLLGHGTCINFTAYILNVQHKSILFTTQSTLQNDPIPYQKVIHWSRILHCRCGRWWLKTTTRHQSFQQGLDPFFRDVGDMGAHGVKDKEGFGLAKESTGSLVIACGQPQDHVVVFHPPLFVLLNNDTTWQLGFDGRLPLKNYHGW